MGFNYLLLILNQNISVYVFLLSLIFIYYKLIKYLTADNIILDMTKTKWNRDIPIEQLYDKEDVPPENLTGWVPLFRSDELGINQVKGAHFFGEDLMVFRSSTGKAYVLDAYCPHMGTYLPAGGKVVGESVRCPFHAWTFNGKGECTHVPGLNAPNLPKAKLKTWVTHEVNGLIMFWYDLNDEPPKWLPLENKEIEQLKFRSTFVLKCTGHFTEIAYNSADYMHFDAIHTSPGNVDPGSVFQQNLFFHLMTKIVRFDFKPKFTRLAEKHRFEFSSQILVYLFGKLIISDIVLSFVIDGPYLAHWKLSGGPFTFANLHMTSTTVPIPGRKFRYTMYTYTKPTLLARIISVLFLRFEGSQLQRDAAIWSGKKMIKKPYFSKLEKDLVELTRWINQFYPKDKKLTVQEQED